MAPQSLIKETDNENLIERPAVVQKHCFLTLPLNVRQKIYHFALVPERVFIKPFVPTCFRSGNGEQEKYETPNLAVLRVCKQIYEEAALVFYKENKFSIVVPDFLLCMIQKYPRLAQNIKLIRHVEIIFDICDFHYLTGVFRVQLEMMGQTITRQEDKFPAGKPAAKKIFAVSARLAGAEEYIVGKGSGDNTKWDDEGDGTEGHDAEINMGSENGPAQHVEDTDGNECKVEVHCQGAEASTHSFSSDYTTDTTPTFLDSAHEKDIARLNDLLWGRTLTFIRQRLQLEHIYMDFKGCFCPGGCCRPISHAMEWGIIKHFYHGIPNFVSISGASEAEREEVVDILHKQRLTRRVVEKMSMGENSDEEFENTQRGKTGDGKEEVRNEAEKVGKEVKMDPPNSPKRKVHREDVAYGDGKDAEGRIEPALKSKGKEKQNPKDTDATEDASLHNVGTAPTC
ncbi:hypothetical protein CPC735_014620 [Coccidioides posadasii C735 delta SOWgp]|uniref:DUF7730 domain-containing protein n=1 Tax=Coccidioides posadasii (strain C735) TaxID=222929 RepID=C5PCQ4_COCP7|nr:hypothetical protein CPC735_014620 [Coccidioides posadasii C735 delta SOWgp]EER24865.1 hypothetical protein CPC735_014620 [Coccidioides posadasii C735 delta SOWgp]|eukprot:XP_003067010.1 hypothetical protein CPC735_014620 [Coccidioides posadasii C735 delta SOWgp]